MQPVIPSANKTNQPGKCFIKKCSKNGTGPPDATPGDPLYPPNSSLNWLANDSVTIRLFYPNQ